MRLNFALIYRRMNAPGLALVSTVYSALLSVSTYRVRGGRRGEMLIRNRTILESQTARL
ncbi:hypothetical protein HD806DRAFT_380166 [Xylariaceae sp. AK1471]|nr:hypothetical protein HD806DRAFT_380166 [Xylariaceae sp. AK1471]